MSDYGLLMNKNLGFDVEEKEVNELPKTKEKDAAGDKKIKIVKIIFCVLCIALVVELAVYKYIMPCLSSPKVTVTGQDVFSAEELAAKLLTMGSHTWIDFDVDEATAILSSEPGIDDVIVEKKFPDKIFIEIVERKPVAVTFIVEEGSSIPMQIDRKGNLFPVRNNSVLNTNTIPIISGLQVEHMSGGMKIQNQYLPLIDQISKISETEKNLFAGLSEICVIPAESGSYDLSLIPSQSKTKVMTDRSLNEDSLKYMMVVLDVIKNLDTPFSEVDLRYGQVSCKK